VQKNIYGKLHLKKIPFVELSNYNNNIIRDDIPFLRDTSHSALNICGLKLRVMVAVSKHQLLLYALILASCDHVLLCLQHVPVVWSNHSWHNSALITPS
jgi:hypothetical protein